MSECNELADSHSVNVLEWKKYQPWYEAIIYNDFEAVRNILTSVTEEHGNREQQKLLNGKFDLSAACLGIQELPTPDGSGLTKWSSTQVWHLLGTLTGEEIIRHFLAQEELNIHVQNKLGNNVVYCLAVAVSLQPNCEDEMIRR